MIEAPPRGLLIGRIHRADTRRRKMRRGSVLQQQGLICHQELEFENRLEVQCDPI